jgi:large-conductance mechanosensitive channel
VPDFTNALVAEWRQVPRAMFQHLVESLSRRVEVVIAAMFQHLVESLSRRVEVVIAAMFQHLVESLSRRVEVFIAAKGNQLHINAQDFGM